MYNTPEHTTVSRPLSCTQYPYSYPVRMFQLLVLVIAPSPTRHSQRQGSARNWVMHMHMHMHPTIDPRPSHATLDLRRPNIPTHVLLT